MYSQMFLFGSVYGHLHAHDSVCIENEIPTQRLSYSHFLRFVCIRLGILLTLGYITRLVFVLLGDRGIPLRGGRGGVFLPLLLDFGDTTVKTCGVRLARREYIFIYIYFADIAASSLLNMLISMFSLAIWAFSLYRVSVIFTFSLSSSDK